MCGDQNGDELEELKHENECLRAVLKRANSTPKNSPRPSEPAVSEELLQAHGEETEQLREESQVLQVVVVVQWWWCR